MGTCFVWCAQGTVLSPLLFSLHLNDIMVEMESEICLFADDCDMRFQPVKCYIMQLTRKRI